MTTNAAPMRLLLQELFDAKYQHPAHKLARFVYYRSANASRSTRAAGVSGANAARCLGIYATATSSGCCQMTVFLASSEQVAALVWNDKRSRRQPRPSTHAAPHRENPRNKSFITVLYRLT